MKPIAHFYKTQVHVPAVEVGRALGLTAEQVERVYRDIDQKRRSTRYLHLAARLVGEVEEVPV